MHNLRLNMSITSLVCTSYITPISTHVQCNRHHYTAPSSMYMYTCAHRALPTCCVTGCVNLCQLFTQHGNQTSENPSLSQDGNLLHRTCTSGDLHQVHNTRQRGDAAIITFQEYEWLPHHKGFSYHQVFTAHAFTPPMYSH